MAELTLARLREVLHYDPETGEFRWIKNLQNRHWRAVGRIITGRGGYNRYLRIQIDKKLYLAHRLIFFYMLENWPPEFVDHINGNGLDNRWDNLRLASALENAANRKMNKNNTSGFTGVTKRGNKWIAQIGLRKAGTKHYIGIYNSREEAYKAYLIEAVKVYKDFTPEYIKHCVK